MKRMTALILALILMLSVLPLASFAATGYTKTYTMLKPNDLSNTEIAKRGDLGFWKQLSVKPLLFWILPIVLPGIFSIFPPTRI